MYQKKNNIIELTFGTKEELCASFSKDSFIPLNKNIYFLR